MQYDTIENFYESLIQHGKSNNRIYLMKYKNNPLINIIEQLEKFAKKQKYTKIFAKISEKDWPFFKNYEYIIEAKIPNFFINKNNCLFIAKYFSKTRKKKKHKKEIKNILKISKTKINQKINIKNNKIIIKKATTKDAKKLSLLYKIVFPSYPFPIDNPTYIEKTMKTHIDYYFISNNNKIIAASSAEKDLTTNSVEMTDFATLPEYRGKGYANTLLQHMEKEMTKQNIKSFFTIARALSFGMNITFAKNNYQYAGTLTNNTFIFNKIESMNVWYKINKLFQE